MTVSALEVDAVAEIARVFHGLRDEIIGAYRELVRAIAGRSLTARQITALPAYEALEATIVSASARLGGTVEATTFMARGRAAALALNEVPGAILPGARYGAPSSTRDLLIASGLEQRARLRSQVGTLARGRMLDPASYADRLGYRAQMVARTEVHRAYREAVHDIILANPNQFVGWTWVAGSHPCAYCLGQHGTFHQGEMVTHPNCRCRMAPRSAGDRERTITGVERFSRLSDARQEELLGPTLLRAYTRGDFSLRELYEVSGRGVRRRTVEEVLP